MTFKQPNRVSVLVSPAMKELRYEQSTLNNLLWSAEICYGHVLATVPDSDDDVWASFKHANTQAWYPNREGRRKYERTVAQFRQHVVANQRLLHRTILTEYYSSFEHYLRTRVVSSRVKAKETRWGQFFTKLNIDALTKGPFPLQPSTVLTADYCRMARNGIVHHDTPALPRKADDSVAAEWLGKIMEEEEHLADWHTSPEEAEAHLRTLIKAVRSRVVKGQKDGKAPSYDFFYTLFTFTHLDNLAFEIEEALFNPDQPPITRIQRHPSKVRREEMIRQPDERAKPKH